MAKWRLKVGAWLLSVSGVYSLVYIILISVSIWRIFSKQSSSEKSFLGLFKALYKELIRNKQTYFSVVFHILDQASDYEACIEYYYQSEEYQGFDDDLDLNPFWWFAMSVIILVVHRLVSMTSVWRNTHNILDTALQLLDLAMVRAVLDGLEHNRDEPGNVQRMLQSLEAIFESFPQLVLSMVYLLRTKQANPIIIIQALFSIYTLSMRVCSDDADFFPKEWRKSNMKLFKCPPSINSLWVYRIFLFRLPEIFQRVAMISVLWAYVSGPWMTLVIVIDFFICKLTSSMFRKLDNEFNVETNWISPDFYSSLLYFKPGVDHPFVWITVRPLLSLIYTAMSIIIVIYLDPSRLTIVKSPLGILVCGQITISVFCPCLFDYIRSIESDSKGYDFFGTIAKRDLQTAILDGRWKEIFEMVRFGSHPMLILQYASHQRLLAILLEGMPPMIEYFQPQSQRCSWFVCSDQHRIDSISERVALARLVSVLYETKKNHTSNKDLLKEQVMNELLIVFHSEVNDMNIENDTISKEDILLAKSHIQVGFDEEREKKQKMNEDEEKNVLVNVDDGQLSMRLLKNYLISLDRSELFYAKYSFYLHFSDDDTNKPYYFDQLLHFCVEHPLLRGMLQWLLSLDQDSRLDVNVKNAVFNTHLFVAAQKGNRSAVECLISDNRVKLNMANETGRTALIAAVIRRHADIAGVLVNHEHCDQGIIDERGKCAIEYALEIQDEMENKEMILALTNNGAECAGLVTFLFRKLFIDKPPKLNCNLMISYLQSVRGIPHLPLDFIHLLNVSIDILETTMYQNRDELLDIFFKNLIGEEEYYAENKDYISNTHNNHQRMTAKRLIKDHLYGLMKKKGWETDQERDALKNPLFIVLLYDFVNNNGIPNDLILSKYLYCRRRRLRRASVSANEFHFDGINQWNALHVCAKHPSLNGMLAWFLRDGNMNVNECDPLLGWNALHLSVYADNIQALVLLLKQSNLELDKVDSQGYTPLMIAAQQNRREMVACLIRHGCNKDLRDSDGRTALDQARQAHSVDVVRLLDNGERMVVDTEELDELAAKFGWDKTLTLQLDSKGQPMFISYLIHYLKSLNSIDIMHAAYLFINRSWLRADAVYGQNHCNALHYCAIHPGLSGMLGWLLENGSIDPNIVDDRRQSPLIIAVLNLNKEGVIKLLNDSRVSKNQRDEHGQTPLHCAVTKHSADIVHCLLKHGCNKRLKDAKGLTPLEWAQKNGSDHQIIAAFETHHESMRYLFHQILIDEQNRALVINEDGRLNEDLLMTASKHPNSRVFRNLITVMNATWNTRSYDNHDSGVDDILDELLMLDLKWDQISNASTNQLTDAVRLVHDYFMDLNIQKGWKQGQKKDEHGNPLFLAKLHDFLKSNDYSDLLHAQYLFNHRHPTEDDDTSALFLCAQFPKLSEVIVWLLKDQNLNPNRKGGQSLETTPLCLAAWFGNVAGVMALLEDDRVNVHLTGEYGWTPLMIAVYNDHPKVISVLLDHGSDQSMRDRRGRTAFDIAEEAQSSQAMRLLLRNDESKEEKMVVEKKVGISQQNAMIAIHGGYHAIDKMDEESSEESQSHVFQNPESENESGIDESEITAFLKRGD